MEAGGGGGTVGGATDQTGLDYLLGTAGVSTLGGGGGGTDGNIDDGDGTASPQQQPGTSSLPLGDDGDDFDDDDGGGNNSATGNASSGGGAGTNPKKRPLEDRKARDRKRILRNRQLARVSNERRKGRIKAMENELTETKLTVSTLEESIRCLEEENRELRTLLHGGTATAGTGAAAGIANKSATQQQQQGNVDLMPATQAGGAGLGNMGGAYGTGSTVQGQGQLDQQNQQVPNNGNIHVNTIVLNNNLTGPPATRLQNTAVPPSI